MSTFPKETLTRMLRDVALLKEMPFGRVPVVADVALHATALVAEVERLSVYEQAMESLAAQLVCPKTTAEELAKQVVKAG